MGMLWQKCFVPRAARGHCHTGFVPDCNGCLRTSSWRNAARAPFSQGIAICTTGWRPDQIRTVVIAGVVTNVCCEGTARDARALGYRVIMVADANATVSDGVHNATLVTVYRSFGDVRPTDAVLDLIAQAETE